MTGWCPPGHQGTASPWVKDRSRPIVNNIALRKILPKTVSAKWYGTLGWRLTCPFKFQKERASQPNNPGAMPVPLFSVLSLLFRCSVPVPPPTPPGGVLSTVSCYGRSTRLLKPTMLKTSRSPIFSSSDEDGRAEDHPFYPFSQPRRNWRRRSWSFPHQVQMK